MIKGLSVKEHVKRYIFFFLGLFVLSIGIALATKGNLGVSPVSSIPYVLSLALPWSLGKITIVVQLIYVACEIIILRKKFNPVNFLQIVIVIIYGYFNDLAMVIVSNIQPEIYVSRWVICIISMFFIAFGVNMEVKAGVMMLAVDGLMVTISEVFHIDFGKVKIAFDCSQVVIAVVCSFVLMHSLQGVREGTIAAAIFVGIIIKFYNKKLGGVYRAMGLVPVAEAIKRDSSAGEEAAVASKHVRVITIGRESGSGGREIGRYIAEKLGVPMYDKDAIMVMAENQGLSWKSVEEKEQNMILGFFARINNETYADIIGNAYAEGSVKENQRQVLRNIASKESCVIVGRVGNYFLRDMENCFHVFIHGEPDFRIKHYSKEMNVPYEQAAEDVKRIDNERKLHYEYYTGGTYGQLKDYHLVIDNSVIGDETSAEIILSAAKIYFEKNGI